MAYLWFVEIQSIESHRILGKIHKNIVMPVLLSLFL